MNKHALIFILGLLLSVIPSTCLHAKQQSPIGDRKTFLEDSYNYFVTDSGNMVWAGALTLAWQELSDNIVKEDVRLDSDDEIVNKIVDNFNQSTFKKNDLSEADYYIKSGYGPKTVTQINTEVKKKFPSRTFPDIDVALNDKDIISYAYLAKSFEYPTKFKVIDDFLFKNKSVKGFRASNDDQRSQVRYFYYQNKNEFLVKLRTKKDNEGVYLLRTDYKEAKVSDIIGQVNKWEGQFAMGLEERDYFQMPVVDLDYNRELSQIENVSLGNEKFRNYVIAQAYEGLKLKIDETGVKVENQGVIIAKLTSTYNENPIEPKYFVLDHTFWIILKEEGKNPYLCIRVNSPKEKKSLQ